MNPFMEVTLISLGLSLLITIIYRFLTNPDEIRKIKDDTKFYKEKMNEAKKAGDVAKMNDYAKEMMNASQRQMRSSMKPMIASMLIFFLLLGWLNTEFGGVSADLTKNPNATFTYGGQHHQIYYESIGDSFRAGVDFNDDGRFSDNETFDNGDIFTYKDVIWRVSPMMNGFFIFATPQENSVHFEMFIAKMPFALPYIGTYLSWFWWYIFISFPATLILRKLLGVE